MATASTSTAATNPSGIVSVTSASSVTVTLSDALSSADYRVMAQFQDAPVLVWATNQTTTSFELQFSATATGKVSYEVRT